MTSKGIAHAGEKALNYLRGLPRVTVANIRDNPGARQKNQRGRGQHGGDNHGEGKGKKQNYLRMGYETGNTPFYLRFPKEMYNYKGHHLKRQYPPITLKEIQLLIDTDRINAKEPIDLVSLINTGIYRLKPESKEFGFQLKDHNLEFFKAKINIEVQHATELVIATIEKHGGVIRTAYYDQYSLMAMRNPQKWFRKGVPIPRRALPPQDAVEYYTNAKNRGYLADPEDISKERQILAQKYGYELPKVEEDLEFEMLMETKDPRQIFYGLQPGWVVNIPDQCIIVPDQNFQQQLPDQLG